MRKVLFVDDELNVLDGLRRTLRARKEWQVEFANSGAEALEILAAAPCDVIVTDMRMPGMDGAALLEAVRTRFPKMLRIILTGQPGDETTVNSSGLAHDYLYKPCDHAKLQIIIERAFALKEMLQDANALKMVGRFQTWPAAPNWYSEIVAAMAQRGATSDKIATIVESNTALSRQFMDVVNSASFMGRVPVQNAAQAIGLMGTRMAKTLLLGLYLVNAYQAGPELREEMRAAVLHSHNTANGARALARHTRHLKLLDEAYIAGLIHDIGRLALMANLPGAYSVILEKSDSAKQPFWRIEQEEFGTTHAAIGAVIASRWDFPEHMLEVVAFHHSPSRCATREFDSLAAVHISDALEYEKSDSEIRNNGVLDRPYLDSLGLTGSEAEWRKVCRGIK